MSSLRWMPIVALCLGLGTACAKSKAPEAGTNTNWLKSCHATADCDGDGTCLCGVCTLGCTTDATCSRVGSRTRCTPMSEASCGTNATGSACLLGESVDPSMIDADSPSTGDAGLALVRVGAVVQVTERYRPCGLDDDCILVGTSCNGCCEQDAIRAHDRDAYAINHELACSGFSGPECNCSFADIVPHCVDGLCRAVAPDPARDCYSPSQNVKRAQVPGALGCACVPSLVGLEACVDFTSLVCLESADGPRWTVVEEGACSFTDCPESRRHFEVDACLAEFARCFARPGAGLCGRGCRQPLPCTADTCPYTPFDPADCSGARVRVWEGVCGNVRYRAWSGGLGGPTWYWDEATGELLAMRSSSDVIEPRCEGEVVGGDFSVVENCDVVQDATTEICNSP